MYNSDHYMVDNKSQARCFKWGTDMYKLISAEITAMQLVIMQWIRLRDGACSLFWVIHVRYIGYWTSMSKLIKIYIIYIKSDFCPGLIGLRQNLGFVILPGFQLQRLVLLCLGQVLVVNSALYFCSSFIS